TLSFRKGTTPDGNRPVMLYGYGGFDVSLLPKFSPLWLAWMEREGVLATANLRGGGEDVGGWRPGGGEARVREGLARCAAERGGREWGGGRTEGFWGGRGSSSGRTSSAVRFRRWA